MTSNLDLSLHLAPSLQAQITALGLERVDGNGKSINGLSTPVLTSAGMDALDKREVGYTRVAVPLEHIKLLGWASLPDGAEVWMCIT